MNRETAKAIFEEAKANTVALNNCAGPHVFEDITPELKIGKRFRCRLCGGALNGIEVRWYQRGLEHGRAMAARATMKTIPDTGRGCPIPDDSGEGGDG